jgi:hypothetical protein
MGLDLVRGKVEALTRKVLTEQTLKILMNSEDSDNADPN